MLSRFSGHQDGGSGRESAGRYHFVHLREADCNIKISWFVHGEPDFVFKN